MHVMYLQLHKYRNTCNKNNYNINNIQILSLHHDRKQSADPHLLCCRSMDVLLKNPDGLNKNKVSTQVYTSIGRRLPWAVETL